PPSHCWTAAFSLLLIITGNGIGAEPPARLTPQQVEELLADLSSENDRQMFQAVGTLAAHPAQALALVRSELFSATPVDAELIDRAVNELDHDRFSVRRKATETLERLGSQAEWALRKALARKLSLEQSKRIERLLELCAGKRRLQQELGL